MRLLAGLFALSIAFLPVSVTAQGLDVAFGSLTHDSTLPVEVTADQLEVNQQAGTAIFSGNVLVGQGSMRLSANRVEVSYAGSNGDPTGRISNMVATGNVLLVNGAEAAEAQKAVYAVDRGSIVMSGSVLLTQGQNALSGELFVVDLGSGTGRMEGRVKTIFQTGNAQ